MVFLLVSLNYPDVGAQIDKQFQSTLEILQHDITVLHVRQQAPLSHSYLT